MIKKHKGKQLGAISRILGDMRRTWNQVEQESPEAGAGPVSLVRASERVDEPRGACGGAGSSKRIKGTSGELRRRSEAWQGPHPSTLHRTTKINLQEPRKVPHPSK